MKTGDKVDFICRNCNSTRKIDILPSKHAILGTLPKINKKATCCKRPDYKDEKGFHTKNKQGAIREYIPGFA